ncbi:MAG TPA: hypothetical protein VEW25_04695 [Allosphingosinicella sp.]|nr:hypothetical protein [Allosphingosinicella sp.]
MISSKPLTSGVEHVVEAHGSATKAHVPRSQGAIAGWAAAILYKEPIGSAVAVGLVGAALADSILGFLVAAVAALILRHWLFTRTTA